jgi:ribosomal peptide maturation radical SAM protein 1
LAETVASPEPNTIAPDVLAWLSVASNQVIEWIRRAPGVVHFTRRSVLRGGLPLGASADVLLIVPPFASLWYPSLGAHVLQACARRAGFRVDVLYANVLLAAYIGERSYEQIASETIALAAERFFARSAFGLPPLGHGASEMFDPRRIFGPEHGERYRGLYPDGKAASLGVADGISLRRLARLERLAPAWVERVARAVAARRYRIVGSTTTFQQTGASVALLNRIKLLAPNTVTVLGGANCEGEMAEGLAALDLKVDHFFSGESEETFPEFVRAVLSGERPATRIIQGRPCEDMDAIPNTSCGEYFDQRARFLPHSVPVRATYLSYETSRGCWWGQKQHCSFCGLNGEGMAFRRKSPERVIDELRAALRESPTRNISMTDNIMPHEYLTTLVPRLRSEFPGVNIFYEQKANLSFEDVLAFKQAGITMIQPGIEALSSPLLKLMRKGVLARQNLMLLRYGRIAGVKLIWNLLCGFPNDEVLSYHETLQLVPLITHLQPPSGLWHLGIDRFSPYFFEPSRHHITNIQPWPVYCDFLPEGADVSRIAYHFVGDYPCDTHRHMDVIQELNAQVKAWMVAWQQPTRKRPELKICRQGSQHMLVDTRGLFDTTPLRALDEAEASLLLTAQPYSGTVEENQAIESKLAAIVDHWFVPLPVARLELLSELTRAPRARVA